jgi:hypothetical protein
VEEPVAPLAQQTIQADLERLRAQRDRYALALQSSEDERACDRHARTISRLDDEIAALEQALGTLSSPDWPVVHARDVGVDVDPWGVPVVDRTVELGPDAFDDGAFARRGANARLLAIGVSVGAIAIGAVLWLASRPSAKPVPPAPAPTASIVVSSPVPPDPDEQPPRNP